MRCSVCVIGLLLSAITAIAHAEDAGSEQDSQGLVPYVSVDGGVSIIPDNDVRFFSIPSQLQSNAGGSVGIELGAQAGEHLRFALSLLYDRSSTSSLELGGVPRAGGQTVDMLRPMWNLYCDFSLLDGLLRPYVGAGLGAAWARFDSMSLGYGEADGWGMAFAAHLGSHVSLGRGWLVKLGYRYNTTASLWNDQATFLSGNLSAHDFLLGLRKDF